MEGCKFYKGSTQGSTQKTACCKNLCYRDLQNIQTWQNCKCGGCGTFFTKLFLYIHTKTQRHLPSW